MSVVFVVDVPNNLTQYYLEPDDDSNNPFDEKLKEVESEDVYAIMTIGITTAHALD